MTETIPARIRHLGVCGHPQTPAARRACRKAKIAAITAVATPAVADSIPAGYYLHLNRKDVWIVDGPDGWRWAGMRGGSREMAERSIREHATGAPARAAKRAAEQEAEAKVNAARQARADELAAVAAVRGPLATVPQVEYILRLLARRERYGDDTPGFMIGPGSRREIEEMSLADASAYISSLTGQY